MLSSESQDLYLKKSLPANGRFVRLLNVHAPDRSAVDGGPLHGTLVVANLDTKPSFTSLSYVWAQKSFKDLDDCYIICEGVRIAVTPSCFLALLHLRQKLQFFTVWIDAICINQSDNGEKSQQIPLLGEIYTHSRAVYIWLGEGTAATDRAISYLDTAGFVEYIYTDGDPNGPIIPKPRLWTAAWIALTSFARRSKHPFPFLNRDSRSWRPRCLSNRYPSPKAKFASYHDLGELLTREWIGRIWTYQEIMLARNPTIVCGSAHIPWSRFALSILFLDHIQPIRLGNLGTSTTLAIKTWKKMVLTRERLTFETLVTPAGRVTPRESSEPMQCSNFATATSDFGSNEKTESQGLYVYRNFLFDVFIRCLALGHCFVCLAYLSLVNLIMGILIVHFANAHAKRGIYSYLAISAIAFAVTFPAYIIMMYSYYYTKMFSMPTRKVWLQTMEDDSVDDFMNAVITRKAKDAKDVAFGLQSVLTIKLGKALPPPNYAASLAQVYEELTLHLLHATGHLHFLLPAAERAIPGLPSWIPDWSVEFPAYWLRPFTRFTSIKENWIPRSLFVSSRSNRNTGGDPCFWSQDSHQSHVLTIMAHDLCTISDTFELQATKSHFDPAEFETHVDNIRKIQSLFAFTAAFHRLGQRLDGCYFTNFVNFPSLPEDINPDHLRLYWNFVWNSKRLGAHRTLELWTREGGRSLHPLPYGLSLPLYTSIAGTELLRIHIAICNDFVRTRRKFFSSVRYEAQDGNARNRTFGICSADAKIGDTVILVPGLPSLLVVRPNTEEKGLQLISPAVSFEDVRQVVKDRVKRANKTTPFEVLSPFILV